MQAVEDSTSSDLANRDEVARLHVEVLKAAYSVADGARLVLLLRDKFNDDKASDTLADLMIATSVFTRALARFPLPQQESPDPLPARLVVPHPKLWVVK